MYALAAQWSSSLIVPLAPGARVGDSPASDAELVVAARGDAAAFDPLYRRHLPAVYRYVYAHVGAAADAEDITSAVFLDCLTSLRNYREQGHFVAWLFTIAQRHIGAHYRRRRRDLSRRAEVSDEAWDQLAGGDGPRDAQRLEQAHVLVQAMTRLSDDQREALALRFYGGLKVAEIARLMGKGESAVKMILHRGLAQLKVGLTPSDAERAR